MGDVLKYGLGLAVFCTGFRVCGFLRVAVSSIPADVLVLAGECS